MSANFKLYHLLQHPTPLNTPSVSTYSPMNTTSLSTLSPEHATRVTLDPNFSQKIPNMTPVSNTHTIPPTNAHPVAHDPQTTAHPAAHEFQQPCTPVHMNPFSPPPFTNFPSRYPGFSSNFPTAQPAAQLLNTSHPMP